MKKAPVTSFRFVLLEEYEKRKKKNPLYSKRAFAKLLGVDQSSLSKLFRGERDFSPQTINHCLEILKVDETLKCIIEEDLNIRGGNYLVPEENIIRILGHWKYWAVLEYLKIDSSHDPKGISRRLELTVKDVEHCLEELESFGYIKRQGPKFNLLKPNNSWISNQQTSEARRKLQKLFLQMSTIALEEVPREYREHGSLTVAIDKKKLPELKKKIQEFQKELGTYAQKRGSFNEVYQLTVSFFPLTK